MWLPKRNASLAALLALAVAAPTLADPPAVALADDEDPDVEVAYAGAGATPEVLRFTVKNVGKEKVPATTVKAETLSPAPKNEQTIKVPALDKGAKSFDFTYTLAGPCNGHEVRAKVELKKDEDPSNNEVQVTVCEAKSAPQSKPESKPSGGSGSGAAGSLTDARASGGTASSLSGPASGAAGSLADARTSGTERTDPTPVHLRVGEHAREIEPSVWHRHWLTRKNEGALGCLFDVTPPDLSDSHVGYDFIDRQGCEINQVQQLVVGFDLEWLREAKHFLLRAELLFGERIIFPTVDTPRNPAGKYSCLGKVGLAPRSWPEIVARTGGRDSLEPTLLSTELVEGDPVDGGWDLTRNVRSMTSPDGEQHAFVVHGHDENLDAEITRQCRSELQDVRLRLHYTILS